MSTLVFVGCTALLVWALLREAGRDRQHVSVRSGLAAAAAPALLIILSLAVAAAAGRFGDNRLAVAGLEADLAEGEPFTLGGDAARDDLVISGARPRAAIFREGSGGPGVASGARLQLAPPDPTAVPLVLATGVGAKADFMGAIAFGPDDAVCLARCRGPAGVWFVRRGDQMVRAVVEAGRARAPRGAKRHAGVSMPTRQVGVPYLSYWRPDQAVHPLAHHLPPAAGALDPDGGACGRTIYCLTGNPPESASSFLFRKGGLLGGDWRLMLLDPGARYAPGGEIAKAQGAPAAIVTLAEGVPRQVSLWATRFNDGPPQLTEGLLSRLTERRSLTAVADGGRLRVALHTPDAHTANRCSARGDAGSVLVGAADGGQPGALVFESLGGWSARTASGAVSLPTKACAGLRADDLAVGDLSADHRVVRFQLVHFGFPVLMATIAAAWALFWAVLQRRLFGSERVVWLLVSGLQFLLALRWLVGLGGVSADPSLAWRPLLSEAGVAYVALPLLFLLAATPRRRLDTAALAGVFVLSVAAIVALAAWAGGLGSLAWALLGLVLLVAAWRLDVARGLPWRRVAIPVAPHLRDVVRRGRERLASYASRWPAWGYFLLGAVAFRLALTLVGVKERLGIAVSAAYTPLLIVGFAFLFAEAERADPARRARLWLWYAGALVTTTLAVPLLNRDVGYAMIVAPIAALPLVRALAPLSPAPSRGVRWAWAAPALVVISGLVFILMAGPLANLLTRPEQLRELAAAPTDQPALAFLARQTQLDQNILRLALLGAPQRLVEAGTAEAENLRAWSVQVGAYTDPIIGRGYLSPTPLTPAIRPVQMTDNLSAVHLMSPFGRAAACALIMLLAALALAAARETRPKAGRPRPAPEVAGLLALWVVFGAAAYIILANLQLVPFTGRNVYLLAADSGSDLVEGVGLFALAAWGLRRQRRAGP